MQATVEQLARLVDGRVEGDGSLPIVAARPLKQAGASDISFVETDKHAMELATSKAAAVIAPDGVAGYARAIIRSADPLMAFVAVFRHLNDIPVAEPAGIDPRAAIHPSAVIAERCFVGPFATIGEGATIGSGCHIGPGAVVGRRCRLGNEVTLHPNAILYDHTLVGSRVTIHAGAVIGADGFGYRQRNGRHFKVPQLGYVAIEDDVEIGANATIDRSTFDVTHIGAGTKIDNLVQIAHNCRVGNHNIFVSQSGMAGGSSTGDYVVLAGQAGVVDHVTIGKGAIIGAQAGVTKDVGPGERVLGSPAVPFAEFTKSLWCIKRLPEWLQDLKSLKSRLR